jgi:hypothetical protein
MFLELYSLRYSVGEKLSGELIFLTLPGIEHKSYSGRQCSDFSHLVVTQGEHKNTP